MVLAEPCLVEHVGETTAARDYSSQIRLHELAMSMLFRVSQELLLFFVFEIVLPQSRFVPAQEVAWVIDPQRAVATLRINECGSAWPRKSRQSVAQPVMDLVYAFDQEHYIHGLLPLFFIFAIARKALGQRDLQVCFLRLSPQRLLWVLESRRYVCMKSA